MAIANDLTREDSEAIGITLRRFLSDEVAPKVERPELRLSSSALCELTEQARTLGLLNLDAEPGVGLWDLAEQPGARRHSLQSLRLIAQVDAGIALHLHQLALGAWLSRRLSRPLRRWHR